MIFMGYYNQPAVRKAIGYAADPGGWEAVGIGSGPGGATGSGPSDEAAFGGQGGAP